MTSPDLIQHQHIGRLRTSNYDISNTCNLTCEGCLYFSGAGPEIDRAESDLAKWRDFFSAEALRGINFAYLGGAEPSLYPDRIRACQDSIPFGVIFTNGIKKVESDIRYRIHVSIWGNESRSQLYRGASSNRKAMRNYAGDPRALFVMTLNSFNLAEIPEVVQACKDHGLALTFSLFSSTIEYERNLKSGQQSKGSYFRFSSPQADMRLDDTGLQTARTAILQACKDFPETAKIPPEFVDWMTQPDSLYQLDQDGIATDCGNRLTRHHAHYNADLTKNSGKCCAPNIDCRSCRAYAMSYATYFSRRKQMPKEWERVWHFWRDHFLPLTG
ncbi:radical SAM protein [Paracoccus aminophilus]|uniref:Radical SAM domain protein n=1 Tax=Paracoccus aminophilus JCM 7686 TaxID=1367847 RepID=S5YU59_PARAH|nr:radical SAM protein [Paracoccus aminophilus]AGT08776.1 radical SAM domain protein [Paracoccus aminophilus JCM 7686]